MKKVILIGMIVLLCASIGYAETNHQETDGMANGRFILEAADYVATAYVVGAINALDSKDPGFVANIYPKMTIADIFDSIKQFYQNNPSERHRKVVDVLMSGCKLKV